MTKIDYTKAWKDVQEFQQKGLPESALKAVNEIYQQAKKEENAGQLVKAIIHQLKFTDYKEENAFVKNLKKLKDETDAATFPVKPLLHSMLGEMYWQYYQNNRYRFQNRTTINEPREDDIETWSLDKIVSETFLQHKLALADADKSKTIPINHYEEVIHSGNVIGRKVRPTLYDFLAHRALAFSRSEEPDLAKPTYAFEIDEPSYLAPAREFVSLKLDSPDSMSLKMFALQLYQDLIRFHIDDKDPEAFAEIEMERIGFVEEHLIHTDKAALYMHALNDLERQLIRHPSSTKVTYLRALVFRQSATLYKPLVSEEHKWDLKRSIEIADSALQRFHDSEGAILCESLKAQIHTKTISAVIEENNVSDAPFRALVRYQNFTALNYRIIKVTRDEVRAERKKWDNNYNVDREQKFIEHFTGKKVVQSGKFSLPDDGDFQTHSLEVKINSLLPGEYMVIFSNRDDFKTTGNGIAYAFTTISNISYVHRQVKDGGVECYVVHRVTGEPLKGVVATIFSGKYNYKSGYYEPVKLNTYTSNEKGYFKVPYLGKEEYRNFYMEFAWKNDANSTESIDRSRYYAGSIAQYKYEDPSVRTQTFFFLDRAIYRPGQTIYFKGLVTSTDGKTSKIVPGYKTTLILYDVNSQSRGEVQVTANAYGTYSGTFTAPSSGLMGEMRIADNGSAGQVSFSVEEYKRPKFEVAFDTLKGSYRLNEKITTSGYARAYSGANVDGAKVSYRVVRVARFPIWWWGRWGNPTSPEMEITHGETQTDKDGKFVVTFDAIPDRTLDKSSDPTFDYQIIADVTDINGETHSNSTTVSVGYKALQLNVPVGDINQDSGEPRKFRISATNLAGTEEPASGTIKIFSLNAPDRAYRSRLWEQPDRYLYPREEYSRLFPNDLYKDENNKFTWERGREVLNVRFDTGNDKTLQLSDLDKWATGEYVLEITSQDKYGEPVKNVTYFTVFAPSKSNTPVPSINYFKSIKSSAEPGEKAKFVAGTSEKEIRVLYELERDGSLLSSEWLTIKNQQRVFEVPIREEYRGNISVHYTFVKNNRLYANTETINVPYSNKVLDISFESFRDKLMPGAKEQWKIRITGKAAEKVSAEMVATLYDESLDVFRVNQWYASFFASMYSRLGWQSTNGFSRRDLTLYTNAWDPDDSRGLEGIAYDQLNWFEYSFYSYYYGTRKLRAGGAAPGKMMRKSEVDGEVAVMSAEASMDEAKASAPAGNVQNFAKRNEPVAQEKAGTQADVADDLSQVKLRTNFNETAFFYPHLETNERGEIIINFTVPDALTRWKMLGFAHTKDLKSGYATNKLVTQKDLMVVPNAPRFFRENDKMMFSVKISSLVDTELEGTAKLEFIDPFTAKPVNVFRRGKSAAVLFKVGARQSTIAEWDIEIPEGIQALTYRVVAKAGNFSDGEEMTLPVLTNSILVTESLPLPIRGHQKKDFVFEKLLNTNSPTRRNQQFTLEFTSNPAWYAIQALPYLMEYPYDCVEQTFSKYYANSIASHIANSNPRIKQVFDTWRNIQPDALLSNLEKNQELKSAILEETPWVLQANNETQRKRNVGLLFDLNKMANERERALEKIAKAQSPNGGFSWFPGLPEDRYMTQHIVAGMGHLDVMGVTDVRTDTRSWNMVTAAIGYLDQQIKRDYDELKARAKKKEVKLEDHHISYFQIQYLYARSYFKDLELNTSVKEAFDYYLGQAKKYWLTNNLYMEGMTCLALHRYNDPTTTSAMIKSFSERALKSDEMGMYWKSEHGYFWYQAPIETQALMIEVYEEVARDEKSVEALKVWLLKQKQTQDWRTTKATTEACYALLRRGTNLLTSTAQVDIQVGKEKIDPSTRPDIKAEAGTGYFKTAWKGSEVTKEMGRIHVEKKDDGVAWGAAYWQYFEQLDKITVAETPLKLKTELFKVTNTDKGPVLNKITEQAPLHVGDLVKVRIELRTDRTMEYVHLKDMRAAGFEPVSTLSTYRFQDGLYYYESPRDMATNFFIGYLRKGTYVFEYELRVSQKGDFSNGVTTIQCMYAPEFTSHSQGIRVIVN